MPQAMGENSVPEDAYLGCSLEAILNIACSGYTQLLLFFSKIGLEESHLPVSLTYTEDHWGGKWELWESSI